jgi:hypothetical protein
MPLHRDIHWIGRQWAVTGHGMQLIDQKLQGFFDIEVSKLWDFDLIEAMHAKEWLNTADFEKALGIARARYPQLAGAVAAPAEVTRPLAVKPIAPIAEVAKPAAPKPEAPRAETLRTETPKPEKPDPVEPQRAVAELQAPAIAAPVSVEPPSPPLTLFQMQYAGRARFVRPWRVVARKI